MIERLGGDAARLEKLGVEPGPVARAAIALEGSFAAGGKALTFGNGGSAADAQHFAAEMVGRFEIERRPLPAIALTTDTSALTAIANDYDFESVFARQIEALGRPGDVAIGLSTSGSSANVLAAIDVANERGLTTIGLCGRADSPLRGRVDVAIVAEHERTADVQEAHLAVEHAICRAIDSGIETNPNLLPAPGSVVSMDQLLTLRAGWAAGGRVVVWTNGVFDALHAGHLASLKAASALGDVLVVGINSDAVVRSLKGDGRPLVPAEERAELLAALRMVDCVVVFGDETPERVLAAVQPDVHCKGEDYRPPDGKPIPELALVESYGGRVEFLPLVPGRSTSRLIDSINEGR